MESLAPAFMHATAAAAAPSLVTAGRLNPYLSLDNSLDNMDLNKLGDMCGTKKSYVLSFAVPKANPQNGGSKWKWNGIEERTQYNNYFVKKMRDVADLTVSFGGAGSKDIVDAFSDENEAYEVYNDIIAQTGIKKFDFDIEGSSLGNDQTVALRRIRVVKRLKETHNDLHVTYTVPVSQNGLTQEAQNLLANVMRENAIDMLNIMAFDFYGETSGKIDEDPSKATISALTSTVKQVPENLDLAFTMMIGKEDDPARTMTVADIDKVMTAHATDPTLSNRYKEVRYWSLNRDMQPTGPNSNDISATSGVNKYDFEYYANIQSYLLRRVPN